MPGRSIEDLAHPRLTRRRKPRLLRRRQAGGADRHAVLAEAAARTGLGDFGPDDFTERLSLWLAEMDTDEQRTGLAA